MFHLGDHCKHPFDSHVPAGSDFGTSAELLEIHNYLKEILVG